MIQRQREIVKKYPYKPETNEASFSIQAASSSLQLRKYLSQAPVEDQVGVAVIGRFIPVDEDQAVAAVVLDETGGRIYREAGATYHQQVCLTNGADAAGQRLLVQALLIKDDIRLDRTPTGAQRYPWACFTYSAG